MISFQVFFITFTNLSREGGSAILDFFNGDQADHRQCFQKDRNIIWCWLKNGFLIILPLKPNVDKYRFLRYHLEFLRKVFGIIEGAIEYDQKLIYTPRRHRNDHLSIPRCVSFNIIVTGKGSY